MSNTKHPQYTNIFNLITEVYANEALYEWLYDTPKLQDAYHSLPADVTHNQAVRHVIGFAEKNNLLDFLLTVLNTQDAGAYERHQPYFGDEPTDKPVVHTLPTEVSNVSQLPEPQPAGSISVGNIEATSSTVVVGHGASGGNTVFDQQGQTVANQTNIAGNATFNNTSQQVDETPIRKGLSSVNIVLGIIAGLFTIAAAIFTIWGDSILSSTSIPTTVSTTSSVATATFTPSVQTTRTPVHLDEKLATEFGSPCLIDYLAAIADQRRLRMEVGASGQTISLSLTDQENEGGVGPYALELTENNQPLAAVSFLYFPQSESFKILSIQDTNCQPVDAYANETRGGDKNTLQNWDVLRFHISDSIYGIRFGDQGSRLSLGFRLMAGE